MSQQAFVAPTELDQAHALLSDPTQKTIILAGGTDLMPRFNRHRRKREEVLVFLGKLGLDYIRVGGDRTIIGACATLSAIVRSPEVNKHVPLLAKACRDMASPAVRNAATLGGNVATNARSADGIAALTALGATVVTASAGGEGRWPVEAFIRTPKTQTLAHGGLIRHFEVPCLDGQDRWAWEKLKQRRGESRSILSVSFRARMEGPRVSTLRLVLGAMGPQPFVSRRAAALLDGKIPTSEIIEQVSREIISETKAATDARATAWYRERAAQALVARILSQLV
jgi:CO/xanthine dehydrogenase FAD-binding subunit